MSPFAWLSNQAVLSSLTQNSPRFNSASVYGEVELWVRCWSMRSEVAKMEAKEDERELSRKTNGTSNDVGKTPWNIPSAMTALHANSIYQHLKEQRAMIINKQGVLAVLGRWGLTLPRRAAHLGLDK